MNHQRVSGFPEKGAGLRGTLGNFRGKSGELRGKLGNFWGTTGLLLRSTVRELPEKSPKNFRGSSGNLPGKSGDFPEARGEPDSLPATRQICLLFSVYDSHGHSGALQKHFSPCLCTLSFSLACQTELWSCALLLGACWDGRKVPIYDAALHHL